MVVLAVVVISAAQYRAANRSYVPLSQRQPERRREAAQKTPLGYEALDMSGVHRAQRMNQGLERSTILSPRLFGKKGSELDDIIDPEGLSLPDNETYSARYHAAFHKDTNKDKDK
ncbi:hypothetical protein DSW25_08645 [Sulfitobacter donghicola DSW-25 = KCTC 12864 = JCM 14565]|uniref:Uncharacterized protein n=1 Tax=Sulfitobacter donghicola DSW-25 = KCTC 12864 = JCM 14565 TaxID=1300350 RepID=A0A073IXZ0_9RHOB|nr:hypothetical protein DSW25_08645 [Sulfitobacter donghicola DSW-25 = KCTC 12864 = JCM 14565]